MLSEKVDKEVADKFYANSSVHEPLRTQMVEYLAGVLAAHRIAAERAATAETAQDVTAILRAEAIQVIRFARTNEPHDDWNDWQNAILNGLLRAYNMGVDSCSGRTGSAPIGGK